MPITNKQIHAELQKVKEDVRDIKIRLLDPDDGAISRVNRNTSYRKVMTKALWVIYAVTIGLVVKMFWE